MKSKIFVITFTMLFMVFLGACSKQQGYDVSDETIRKINFEETYPDTPGELQTIYRSIKDIASDSDDIVKVNVIGNSIEMLDGYPQVHTLVEVQSVVKGNLKSGDRIEIIEEGGGDEEVLGGIPYLNDELSYVLFLTQYNQKYYIVGAYQGRFVEREGHLFQQASTGVKLRNYAPISTDEFLRMIEMTTR